tara:strand:- start:263 stop:1402 length:1140 start_codon:yes stop_codon:yes gene_type:complete
MKAKYIHQYKSAIVGAGCAGLTLAYHLIDSELHPSILLDPQSERKDHIWSYWDDGQESLSVSRNFIKKKWARWAIKTHDRSIVRCGDNFAYVAISSAEYESSLIRKIESAQGKILRDKVISATTREDVNILKLSTGVELETETVFDSRPQLTSKGTLYQHFVGWTIQSSTPIFDDSTAILMDFRVSQEPGIHFIYLLPFSETSALIESTVYSTQLLPTLWYEKQIRGYIEKHFPKSDWKVINTESGAIPLNKKHPQSPYGIPVGLNSGIMRSSTGYAFSQILFQINDLVKSIKRGDYQKIQIKSGATQLETIMDKIFLNVLSQSPEIAPEVFAKVLESLRGDEFAQFMNGHCPISIKTKIINALPKTKFLKASIRSIFE